MRKTALPLIVTLGLAITAIAAPQKRQAFGTIQFGDSQAEATKGLEQITAGVNRRKSLITASDVMKSFVTNGAKYPPKLAAKYAKVPVSLQTDDVTNGLTSLSITTSIDPSTQQEDVKGGWEVFRDIAESKFGKPVQSGEFPNLPRSANGIETTTTHLWQINGIEVRLGVQTTAIPGQQVRHSAILTAVDTSLTHAGKQP